MHAGKGNERFKCSQCISSGFRTPRGDRKLGGLHNKAMHRRADNGDQTSGATYNAVFNETQVFKDSTIVSHREVTSNPQ